MRNIIRVTLLAIVLSPIIAAVPFQTNDCKIFHSGTFKYAAGAEEITVKIKGKKHVEYHNSGKYVIESKLNWISDCEYDMTMTKITIPNFPYKPGDVMNVKVEKIDGNEIYYQSTVKGFSWKGHLTKLSDSAK